jgi:Na+:H+ antiporter, NhaA family
MNDTPSRSERPHGILQPFREFLRLESSAGILLMVFAIFAIILANSPMSGVYARLCNLPVGFEIDGFRFSKPLLFWINDGLMSVFFFLVGLEIKREFILGEFANLRLAVLPIAAAFGGMLVPALLYGTFNAGTAAVSGWGIPMATDIAFSLGVMALLGGRVPLQLKVFLTAFAIVDDLGAVLVIAIFYGSPLHWVFLLVALVCTGLLGITNAYGVRHAWAYLAIGSLLWIAVLASGVHPTVAGVLLALTIPVRPGIRANKVLPPIDRYVAELRSSSEGDRIAQGVATQSILQSIGGVCRYAISPLHRLEGMVHPWVGYGILPIFALANAGVAVHGELALTTHARVSLGIVIGLLIGKQVGITLFSWIAVRLGMASLPPGVSWKALYAVSWLGAIGFTMSIFIANLAFTDPGVLESAKLAILSASCIAGFVGYFILRAVLPVAEGEQARASDLAETDLGCNP